MTLFRKIASALCTFGAVGGGIAMFLMMAQVGADVTMKYLFNRPIQYTLEMVSSYYMVAVVFLPLGLVTKAKAHVIVELFTHGLSKRAMALVDTFAAALSFAYTAMITKLAFRVALAKTEVRESWESSTLDIQVWPARWFLVIGCFLMSLYLIVIIIENLQICFRGSGPDDDADFQHPGKARPDPPDTGARPQADGTPASRKLQNSLKDPATWSH